MELVFHDPRAHPPRMVAAGARARAGLGSRVLSCSRCIACLHAGRATLSRHVMSPHVQTFVLEVLRNGSIPVHTLPMASAPVMTVGTFKMQGGRAAASPTRHT